ncbi:MAG: hypothetical protein QM765_24075 [Myxococcales bacterium]
MPRLFRYWRLHSCKDVDLAVWLDDLDLLATLQKTRARALASYDSGVAHHQVDAFLLEHCTDRYLGRLCWYSTCPMGKIECQVPRCGATPRLKQHQEFDFDWKVSSAGSVVLYERSG